MTAIVYVDGACSGNPGPGGWAYVVLDKDNICMWGDSGGTVEDTTNNRMELTAVIKAVKSLPPDTELEIKSDSLLIVRQGNGEWRRKANLDLWDEYDKVARLYPKAKFKHIKGHGGDKWNEYVDRLARSQAGSNT